MYHNPGGDYYYASWTERIESELAELLLFQNEITHEELTASDAWRSTKKLAKDFESFYHLQKQSLAMTETEDLSRYITESTITIVRPKLHIPITVEENGEEHGKELFISTEKDINARYIDIQPATTTNRQTGGNYNGPHVLVGVNIEEIEIGEHTIYEGYYIAYTPFKNLELSPNHIAYIFN